jgi:hypothetical protein
MTEEVKTDETQIPQIGLNDIRACVTIIDICSKRGAFEGAELTDVGVVRDKLAAFVNANVPAAEEEDESEDAS